ncbi:MAG TPA: hypothetical protein VJR23_00680 [Candidatus Acidoferrales bacterium]|nr:hypothetical protein [Candidatus Acidoferrales bacterium]
MNLSDLVKKYLAASGGYGKSVALASLGYSREETQRLLGTLDEDYHISRFFHFSNAARASAPSFDINGFPQTHVSIDAEIQSIL